MILWDFSIQVEHGPANHQLDIVVIDKEEGMTTIIVNLVVSHYHNTANQMKEKKEKC